MVEKYPDVNSVFCFRINSNTHVIECAELLKDSSVQILPKWYIEALENRQEPNQEK